MRDTSLSVVEAVPSATWVASEGRWQPGSALLGLFLPVALLLGLELLVRFGVTPAHLLPAPTAVLATVFELGSSSLAAHVAASGIRVLIGFAIGAGLGLGVAVAVGLSRRLEQLLDPSFQALRAVPSLAWVPLLLLWLGIDETPKITLIAIGAFFPVYLNVVSGLRNVDRKLVELGETYGLSAYGLARRILLPAALPAIFTGLRTSLSLAWMFLVAAELIAATRGLGYLLTDGRETSRPDIVIAAILLLALLGKFSDGLLKRIEARSLRWRDSFDERLGRLA